MVTSHPRVLILNQGFRTLGPTGGGATRRRPSVRCVQTCGGSWSHSTNISMPSPAAGSDKHTPIDRSQGRATSPLIFSVGSYLFYPTHTHTEGVADPGGLGGLTPLRVFLLVSLKTPKDLPFQGSDPHMRVFINLRTMCSSIIDWLIDGFLS